MKNIVQICVKNERERKASPGATGLIIERLYRHVDV